MRGSHRLESQFFSWTLQFFPWMLIEKQVRSHTFREKILSRKWRGEGTDQQLPHVLYETLKHVSIHVQLSDVVNYWFAAGSLIMKCLHWIDIPPRLVLGWSIKALNSTYCFQSYLDLLLVLGSHFLAHPELFLIVQTNNPYTTAKMWNIWAEKEKNCKMLSVHI